MRLTFDAKISEIEPINPLFSKCKVYVLYTGANRNNSYISKETVEKMLPTLYNIPIVGEFKKNKNDFGDHGGKVELDENGNLEYVNTTVPYGVVPESSEIDWEDVVEEDGTIHQYLTCTGYLWTGRYKELQQVVTNGKGQSMELDDVIGSFQKDNYFHIESGVFSALTILGDDVEPCFESARIEVYQLDKERFKQEFTQMIEELKFSLKEGMKMEEFIKKEDIGTGDKIEIDLSKEAADFDTPWGDVDKTKLMNDILKASNYKELVKATYLMVLDGWEDAPSENLKYPVCMIKNNKLVLSAKGCEAALSYLEKNTDDPHYDEAKSKLKKYYKKLGLDTSNFSKEVKSMKKKDIATKYNLTYEQLEDELRNALSEVKYETVDWNGKQVLVSRYLLVDYDAEFVYAYDMSECIYVKIPYTMQGDNPVLDFNNVSRVKFSPVDWEGNDNEEDEPETFNLKKYFEDINNNVKSEFDKQMEEMLNLKSHIEEMKKMMDEKDKEMQKMMDDMGKMMAKLNEYKEKEIESVFAEFANSLSEEELAPYKEKAKDMELSELKEKLFALVGKKSFKFSTNKKVITVGLNANANEENNNDSDDIFTKYHKELYNK